MPRRPTHTHIHTHTYTQIINRNGASIYTHTHTHIHIHTHTHTHTHIRTQIINRNGASIYTHTHTYTYTYTHTHADYKPEWRVDLHSALRLPGQVSQLHRRSLSRPPPNQPQVSLSIFNLRIPPYILLHRLYNLKIPRTSYSIAYIQP